MGVIVHTDRYDCEMNSLTGCSTSLYVKQNGSVACGIYVAGNLTFYSAEQRCGRLGARLPEIRSTKENEDVLERRVRMIHILWPVWPDWVILKVESSPNISNNFGLIVKNGTFYVKLIWILFEKLLEKIGLLFTPTSGRTTCDLSKGV